MAWEIPSDIDVERETAEHLGGRYTILSDLCSEFQGAVGAFALIGVVLPGVMLGGVIFGWISDQHELRAILGAAAFFIACMTLSINSWIWLRWLRRRKRFVHALIVRAVETEDAHERPEHIRRSTSGTGSN